VRFFLIYILFIPVLFTHCRKDIGKTAFGDYPAEIGKIIGGNCAVPGCHNTASYGAAGNFNLDNWTNMFAGANSGQPVIPFSSRFSSLCYYINTYNELGPQNKPTMPLNKAPLSFDEVKLIRNWIDAGAPDKNGHVKWADNLQRKKLYAVNQGCDVVTVFDSETKMPIRYVEIGNKPGADTPHYLRVSPDGEFWYVVFINNNIMQKFRCSDDTYIGDIPLTPVAAGTSSNPDDDANGWNTFVISPDGKTAYCVSWQQNGKLALVDLENRSLKKYIAGQHWPHGIGMGKDGERIYVASQTGNFLTIWDKDLNGGREIPLENELKYHSSLDLHDMVLAPDGNSLLITCVKTNEVRVLDLETEKVTAIVPTAEYPQEIVYAKSGNQYFVSCPGRVPVKGSQGQITRINGGNYTASNISCGFQPHGMAVDEHKGLLYVLSRNVAEGGPLPHHTGDCKGRNGFVNFIDLGSLKVLPEKFELSVDPYFIDARYY
jgi:YVTN family beta-propeller protein